MVYMKQPTVDDVDREFSSTRPYSLERAAEIIKKSLRYYRELKTQFLVGLPEEIENARRLASLIIDRIEDEVSNTCKFLSLSLRSFNEGVVFYLTSTEALEYQHATEFIKAHHYEIFSLPKTKQSRAINNKKMQLKKLIC